MGVTMAACILFGALYSFFLGNDFTYYDEWDYYRISTNSIASGTYSADGKHLTAFRPPGYPAFIAVLTLLGANVICLRIVNFVLLALCIYLLHRILQEQSSALAATIGVLLVVCYPVLFYTAGTLYPQTIGTCMFLLIIQTLTKNTVSWRDFIWSGLLFGLLVLTIPFFILVLLPFVAWFFLFNPAKRRKQVFLTVAIAFPIIFGWSGRNYLAFDSFVFVSANSGLMLLLGNSENTAANSGSTTDISAYRADAESKGLNPVERDKYFRSKAIEWILGHKIQAVKLYFQKFLNYFNYTNQLGTKSETSLFKDLLMLVTYGPLLLLFLFRILLTRRLAPSKFEGLLIILYMASAVFSAMFFPRIRYRLPFDFLLIAVVAIFMSNLLLGRREPQGSQDAAHCS
ncbi:glycosyltransferase family 39 protein [Candidatus Hydrogenedentota bacterium]